MNLNFVGNRITFYILSSILIIASVGLLISQGLNFGIEFKSGSVFRLSFQEEATVDDVRKILELDKFKKYFQKSQVQEISAADAIGSSQKEFFVTSDFIAGNTGAESIDRLVEQEFKSIYSSAKIHEFNNIGPAIGDDLKEAAIFSIIFSIFVIIFYISVRFEFQYSIVSIVALVHDVMFVLGIFALTQREFSASTIAAILTIIGYSLNDTIVILDRIRENVRLMRKDSIDHIVNVSINQSLSRTFYTSMTTMCPIVILFLWGGTGVANFTFAMLLGVIVGTYSSVCLASPLLVTWDKNKNKKSESVSDNTQVAASKS
ncbi:MAG: protein translocase subunit SecF [bacterium]|nr:protein translocase subunit SecF [bacterium]